MGVVIRGSFDQIQGHTDELVDWISKVRVKKNSVKRRRRKDFRLEAVLSSALQRAETQLRKKQQQRYQRWQRIKMELYKTSSNDNVVCGANTVEIRLWDEKICEDIDSLNSFMTMLKEVKNPLQR